MGSGLNDSVEDVRSLGLLLSFLSPSHEIILDLLLRGGSPRKRWTPDGGIEEVEGNMAGVPSDIASLLSDPERLVNALSALSTAVLKKSGQGYILEADAVERIRVGLTTDLLRFWKTQALIIAYRACSWKYIEPRDLDSDSITPHLRYVAQSCEDCFESLSPITRVDFVLTLLEASRFQTLEWKRYAVSQAAEAMRETGGGQAESWYLSVQLSSAQSLLHRIEGNHKAAVDTIDKVIDQEQPSPSNPRGNAAMGRLVLQKALNCVQVDDLTQAEQVLQEWHPLNDKPSLMEQVIVFRRGVVLGRVLRTQGRFLEAHTHLKQSYDLAEQLREDLTFDEDRRDLTTEMADTLRELDRPQEGEAYLRQELARRGQGIQNPTASGRSLLEASLAEVFFAQGRAEEAERVCAEAEARAQGTGNPMMRLGKLRISLVLAKIRHLRSDHEGALQYWDEAMRQVEKFPGTTGRTTRTILLSRMECMRSLGFSAAREQVLQHTAASDALGTPGGMRYWNSGLRHWQDYLDSQALRTRT